jgi:hypothetical protein
VKTPPVATDLLKASDPMRTSYAHQVTAVVLDSLLKRAYDDGGSDMTLEDWAVVASQESPTFKFWPLNKFMFIRAHREWKFEIMVATLRKLVPLFFALYH